MKLSDREYEIHDSYEYEMAYAIVRYAMTLADDDEVCSKLMNLQNALHTASVFVNEELNELPELAHEMGLDKWQEEDKEWEEEHEAEDEDNEP